MCGRDGHPLAALTATQQQSSPLIQTGRMPQAALRVALMSSQCDWGGGEQYLWSLGQGLIERDHHVLWIAPPHSLLAQRVQAAGYSQCSIAGRKPSPLAMMTLRRRLRDEGIQILHANDSHAILWGSLSSIARTGIRRVGMKHTVFPIRSAVKYNWCLDKVVCVSRAVQNLCLESGIAASRLEVIPGGIEPPLYDSLQQRSIACKKLNIDPGIPLLTAIGSLIPCKGFDTLIKAAGALRQRIPEFCLVVCGEGPMRSELEQLIRIHGLERHVRLIGFQTDPNAWLAAADVFVHPTLSEGLSLVTIAAQMVGTPVVASEVGGLREVMRCSDTCRPLGWIYASSSPYDLADLLEQSLCQPAKRRAFVREAYRSATTRYTHELMMDRFERLYASLVRSARRSQSASQPASSTRRRKAA